MVSLCSLVWCGESLVSNDANFYPACVHACMQTRLYVQSVNACEHVCERASKNMYMCVMFSMMICSRKFPRLWDTLSVSGDEKGSHEWLIRMQLSTALGKTI